MSSDYVGVEIDIDTSDNTIAVCIGGRPAFSSEGRIYITAKNADDLEDLEREIESIAFQIREFRMKNFPESAGIEL